MSDRPSVYESWAGILAELPAIPKERRNQQQGFTYRSVDDVLNHLHGLLAKHGVFVIPVAQSASHEERQSAKGGVIHVVHMTVDWRIYGGGGDYIDAQTMGEGTDAGDKATSKAQTMALKYLLWPALAVAENADPDGDAPPDTSPHPSRSSERMPPRPAEPELVTLKQGLADAIGALPLEAAVACRDELRRTYGPAKDMDHESLTGALKLAQGWPHAG
jgi:hypothetical protein